MSFNIIYTRLFELDFGHEYYADGNLRSFQLSPSKNTRDLLAGGRMLTKKINNKFLVSYSAQEDATTPVINQGNDLELLFSWHVEDPSGFLAITDLPAMEKGNIILLENDPAAASNDPANPEVLGIRILAGLRPQLFTYSVTPSTTPPILDFELTDENGLQVPAGKDANGNPMPAVIPVGPDDSGRYSQQIDLRDRKPGIYTVTMREGATVRASHTYLVDPELHMEGPFGVVRIRYNNATAHLYGDTEYYRAQFTRRSTRWQYFIVNKTGSVDLAAHTLTLTDEEMAASPPYPAVTFITEGAIPNGSIAINGLQTAVFRSQQPMPFYEEPKRYLTLKEVNGTFERELLEHTPNPTTASSRAIDGADELTQIYVFI